MARKVYGDIKPIEQTPGFTPVSGTQPSGQFQELGEPSGQFEEVNQPPPSTVAPAGQVEDGFQPQQEEVSTSFSSVDAPASYASLPEAQSSLVGIDPSIFDDPDEEQVTSPTDSDFWTVSIPDQQGGAEDYSSVLSDIMKPSETTTEVQPSDTPAKGFHPDVGRAQAGEGKYIGNLYVSMGTRAQYRPEAGMLNIAMDFNAAPAGRTARGTEVIIPDNAPPAVRAKAQKFNKEVAMFARRHGIKDYPIRGVKTRTENAGRGVPHTVHVEPFFNTDLDMQKAIKANPREFAQIYARAFGQLPNARLIAAHGVGKDRGAASEVFGDETSFGELMASSLIGG